MKVDTILRYGGIAFIIYLLSTSLASTVRRLLDIDQPRINLGPIQYSGPLPIGVSATVDIPIKNNNAVSFPLDRLTANIVYGTYALSALQMTQPIVIRAGETTVLQFDTQLSFVDLADNIISLITSGQFFQALRVVGTAEVEGVVFPFDHTVSVG